jgi:hypothetical protein
MSYTVRYLPDAEQELAALWMDSTKREAVTQLAILFRVLVSSRLVEIVHIWEFE